MIVFVFLDEAEACCPRTGVGGDGRANLEGRQEFHAGNRFLQQSIKAVHIVPDGICAGHCDIMCGIFAGFLEMLCGDGCNLSSQGSDRFLLLRDLRCVVIGGIGFWTVFAAFRSGHRDNLFPSSKY